MKNHYFCIVRNRERINRVSNYIQTQVTLDWRKEVRESFTTRLSIERLASIACFSPTHFKRFFKAIISTHETPHQYIERLRMQQILRLMKTTSLSFTEIAAYVGFLNTPALNNSLRKLKDATPQELKDTLQAKPSIPYTHPINPPKIIRLSQLIFLSKHLELGYNQPDSQWDDLYEYSRLNGLLPNGEAEFWGITYDDAEFVDADFARFSICIKVNDFNQEDTPDYEKTIIEEGYYLVFTHVGPYVELDSFYDAFLPLIPDHIILRESFFLERYLYSKDSNQLLTEVLVPVSNHIADDITLLQY